MGFLDSIERLINEHGSATILRERIALANDKYAELERRADRLKAQNEVLQRQLDAARLEVRRLADELARLSKDAQPQPVAAALDPAREKILLLLTELDGLSDGDIGQRLGIGAQAARFHLEELRSAHMVRCTLVVGQPFRPWHLSHEGRRYLMSRGLLA